MRFCLVHLFTQNELKTPLLSAGAGACLHIRAREGEANFAVANWDERATLPGGCGLAAIVRFGWNAGAQWVSPAGLRGLGVVRAPRNSRILIDYGASRLSEGLGTAIIRLFVPAALSERRWEE